MKKGNYKKSPVITATELKQGLGKYLSFVGEEQNDVIITKNGKKIARLTPYITDIEQYFVVREKALDYQYGGKKVSYEEFMEIYEKSSLRMEFINGEIYILSSPGINHQEMLGDYIYNSPIILKIRNAGCFWLHLMCISGRRVLKSRM